MWRAWKRFGTPEFSCSNQLRPRGVSPSTVPCLERSGLRGGYGSTLASTPPMTAAGGRLILKPGQQGPFRQSSASKAQACLGTGLWEGPDLSAHQPGELGTQDHTDNLLCYHSILN